MDQKVICCFVNHYNQHFNGLFLLSGLFLSHLQLRSRPLDESSAEKSPLKSYFFEYFFWIIFLKLFLSYFLNVICLFCQRTPTNNFVDILSVFRWLNDFVLLSDISITNWISRVYPSTALTSFMFSFNKPAFATGKPKQRRNSILEQTSTEYTNHIQKIALQ